MHRLHGQPAHEYVADENREHGAKGYTPVAKKTIAEFVEDEGTLTLITELGVDSRLRPRLLHRSTAPFIPTPTAAPAEPRHR